MNSLFVSILLTVLGSSQLPQDFDVIAHRGASGYLPEHTLESAAMAHAFNPDYIEPDLVLTRDGVPIVLHDITLEKTTNVAEVFPDRGRQTGDEVKFYAIDFDWSEIQQLRVIERTRRSGDKSGEAYFPDRFPNDAQVNFKVPSFEEFLQLILGLNQTRGLTIGVYPELKQNEFHQQYFGPDGKIDPLRRFEDIVLSILRKYEVPAEPEHILIQSFSPESLLYFQKIGSPYPMVQLIKREHKPIEGPELALPDYDQSGDSNYADLLTTEGLQFISSFAIGLGPDLKVLADLDSGEALNDNRIVLEAQANGLRVHPYTLRADSLPEGKSFEDMIELLNRLEVDGVFTDHPDQVIDFVKN